MPMGGLPSMAEWIWKVPVARVELIEVFTVVRGLGMKCTAQVVRFIAVEPWPWEISLFRTTPRIRDDALRYVLRSTSWKAN